MATVDDLAQFVGTWRGRGEGSYPTIEAFAYTEELVLTPVPGRPIITWTSRTRDLVGNPRHSESGYLRSVDAGVELVLAHNFGLGEIGVGTVALGGGRLDVESVSMTSTPTAKAVGAVHRRYVVSGDELTYEIAMAAVDVPLTHHLRSTLTRRG